MRRICYVSGTRADFGLMQRTLQRLNAHPEIALSVVATGMHLSPTYGETVKEIEASGLPVVARIPVALEEASGAAMARALASELGGLVDVFEREQPNIVLLLGDRGEMLAGALAAIHLNIPIAHIHGGERSGTVDELVRHAISKLSHYHFTATEEARQRLIRMGERPEHIFVTGAPGLDGLHDLVAYSRRELCEKVGFDASAPVALVVFHPVVQTAEEAGDQARELLAALHAAGVQAICLMPNADAGGNLIRQALLENGRHPAIRLLTHLPRTEFVSWMASADVMVGNSSSGIIEAGSFGLPVVNVGDRQRFRERGRNVLDVPVQRNKIEAAICSMLRSRRPAPENVYGDGCAGERIAELLVTLPLDRKLLEKSNAY